MFFFTLQQRYRTGMVLVVLQFCLLLLLATCAAPKVIQGDVSTGVMLTAACAWTLAVWTLVHNQPGNFNIHPVPKDWGALITTGPYRWVRHPMYTSVLLGSATLAWLSESWMMGWTAWFALAAVLWVKSILEERWIREKHAEYASYARTRKRFVPWI